MGGFLLLIAGLALWWGAHLFRRIAPRARAALGERPGKAVIALALVAAVALMVTGFRSAPVIALWDPPFWLRHVNNLLMLVAIFLMSPAARQGRILNRVRHPMLGGVHGWAVAHLLVNGDLAALMLFGGLFLWALVEMVAINRAEPDWRPGPPGSLARDGLFLVAAAVLLGAIGWVHGMVGPWPFPG